MSTFSIERSLVIEAPLSDVWNVVADLNGYADHVDGLQETAVISGDGPGVRRRCVDVSGNDWEETCVLWEPEQRYVVDVDVSTYPASYRAMFKEFKGTWSTKPVDNGTEVTIRFDAELRSIPGLSQLVKRLTDQTRSDLDKTLASYADAAAGRSRFQQPT